MDYQEAIDAFFDPAAADAEPPGIVTQGSPSRRLRDAFEPVSMHGVWSRLVHDRLGAKGLDFFGGYVLGRAGVMGQPSPSVVAAAFAAFEPSVIEGVYAQALATLSRDEALEITFESTAESLRATLVDSDEAEVAEVGQQLASVVDGLEPTGRALFAGVQAIPWLDDPYGRLWQACLSLREHRGDAHIAAYINAGFGAVDMNILTELWLGYPLGEYSGTRAWPDEATASSMAGLRERGLIDDEHNLTDTGRATRDAIEASTDEMEQDVVDGLGSDLDRIASSLGVWSDQCVAASLFPPDPRKRAAG